MADIESTLKGLKKLESVSANGSSDRHTYSGWGAASDTRCLPPTSLSIQGVSLLEGATNNQGVLLPLVTVKHASLPGNAPTDTQIESHLSEPALSPVNFKRRAKHHRT